MLPWRRWVPIVVVATYCLFAFAANWPTLPGDPNDMRQGDLAQMTWYLAWTPHALLHGSNPLYTITLNYPSGINLAQNTPAPLLGLLAAPLTLAVNPIASLNLLLWLAFPISAASMYFVLRRWVQSELAAFLGGALYGFSPYMVGQSFGHLNLAFVPLPPLILYAAYQVMRPDNPRSTRWGAILGGLIAAQFFISPEVLATTVVTGLIAVVMIACARPDAVGRAVRRSWPAVAAAVVIPAVFMAYPVWFMVRGTHRYAGPAYPGGINSDLLATVTPTSMLRFHHGAAVAHGDKLLNGNVAENGSYLGLPLLTLMAVLLVCCWSLRWIRIAAAMIATLTILSWGPTLAVDNKFTSIGLPGAALNLNRIPLLDNIISSRFALYTALFVAMLVALGIDDVWRRTVASTRTGLRRIALPAVVGVLTIVSALSLVPRWPFPTAPANVPAYFSSDAVKHIPKDSVVLISPYPSVMQVQSQLWQAVARLNFRIIGGYGLIANSNGRPGNEPDILEPRDVETFLWAKALGGPGFPAGPVPVMGPQLVCDFQRFVVNNGITTVLSVMVGASPADIEAFFVAALGPPSERVAEVKAWYSIEPTSTWCITSRPH
jgi:hypothetical protein